MNTFCDTREPVARTMVRSIRIEHLPDENPDLSWLEQSYDEGDIPPEEAAKYREQDRERLAAYSCGEWHMIGIRATAEVAIPTPPGGRTVILQRTTSPGLWGIESDSDEGHYNETAEEECDTLKTMLLALGFDETNINEKITEATS